MTFARIHWHYAAAEFLQSNLVPSLRVCSVSPKALKTQKAIILFLPPVKISSDRWEKDWGRRGTGGVRMVHRGQRHCTWSGSRQPSLSGHLSRDEPLLPMTLDWGIISSVDCHWTQQATVLSHLQLDQTLCSSETFPRRRQMTVLNFRCGCRGHGAFGSEMPRHLTLFTAD